MVLHSLPSYRCGVCGRISRFKRVGARSDESRPVHEWLALGRHRNGACCLRCCPARGPQRTLSAPRTYPMEMQSLAGCAIERLGKRYGKIQKTDFPDRYMVRLRRETDSVTLWDLDLIAVDQESTRVTIVIPPKVENVQPDQIFADLDTCAVPPTGAARTLR